VTHAYDYIKGLITCPQKCELTKISDHCSDINNQAFSHFLSQSPWDHRSLLNWLRDVGSRFIGKNGALVIDECGNPKAGSKSVGVRRQYLGNIGKVDNGQVGVFLAYVKQGTRLLLDFRLYLPKSWTSDPKRCQAAGIPDNKQVFRTKAELAYEMIVEAVNAGIHFSHICMDGFYGSQPWLLTKLELMNLFYVADIGSKVSVYLIEPVYSVPLRKGSRGKEPSRKNVFNTCRVRVDKIVKIITHWKHVRIRKSMDGFLEVKFTVIKVWRIDKNISKPLPVWLLIRKELDDSDIKYSFCNALEIQSWDRLAKMQSERYWIERSFEDAIAIAGMADYQVRNWKAWHHHMSLVLVAMFWITKEQCVLVKEVKDVSLPDMVIIIILLIPPKVQTSRTVARRILKNIRNRRDSRKSKMKRKRRVTLSST
jgi:SRSO17 transposase